MRRDAPSAIARAAAEPSSHVRVWSVCSCRRRLEAAAMLRMSESFPRAEMRQTSEWDRGVRGIASSDGRGPEAGFLNSGASRSWRSAAICVSSKVPLSAWLRTFCRAIVTRLLYKVVCARRSNQGARHFNRPLDECGIEHPQNVGLPSGHNALRTRGRDAGCSPPIGAVATLAMFVRGSPFFAGRGANSRLTKGQPPSAVQLNAGSAAWLSLHDFFAA